MKKIAALLSVPGFCVPLVSLAHPGHGETGGYTITHYFTSPPHLLFSLGALACIFAYLHYTGRNKQPNKSR